MFITLNDLLLLAQVLIGLADSILGLVTLVILVVVNMNSNKK